MKCLYPDQCGLGTDCSKCYEQEVQRLTDAMIRTSAPPTEPGYYWLKPSSHEREIIVEVCPVDGYMRFAPGIWTYPGVSVDVVSSTALWSGPIPSPTIRG